MAEFNPEAIDGDNDGIVQEGTEFERPVEELDINPVEDEAPVVAPEVVEEAPEPVAEEVITNAPASGKGSRNAKEALGPVSDGVIGTSVSQPKPKVTKKKATVSDGDVAVYSTRNVRWEGVGTIVRGYNVVSAADAEKWLTRSHVRAASAAEVAKELGL